MRFGCSVSVCLLSCEKCWVVPMGECGVCEMVCGTSIVSCNFAYFKKHPS